MGHILTVRKKSSFFMCNKCLKILNSVEETLSSNKVALLPSEFCVVEKTWENKSILNSHNPKTKLKSNFKEQKKDESILGSKRWKKLITFRV